MTCGRPTRTGSPCKAFGYLMGACDKHATRAERSRYHHRQESRRWEHRREHWATVPACWTWSIRSLLEVQQWYREMVERPHYPGNPGQRAYDAMRRWQGDRCAVCGWSRSDGGSVVDHDHDTGLVRGFLCRACNTGEGFAEWWVGSYRKYRLWHPANLIGAEVEYHDPFGRPAIRPDCDPVEDAMLTATLAAGLPSLVADSPALPLDDSPALHPDKTTPPPQV